MEKKSVPGMIVLALVVVVLLCMPFGARASLTSTGHAAAPAVSSHTGSAPSHAAHAAPAQMTTYPRTVLVETFTAQWCIYCEMESQAWYSIQHQYNLNILTVGDASSHNGLLT
jgi:thiol:disulfide interchange protein